MAEKFDDFDSNKMKSLEEKVEEVLKEEDTVYNYLLSEEHLDWEDIGWSKATGEKALVFLRRKWKEDGEIEVEKEKDGSVKRKKWVRLDD